jgi:hypothetical protein
LLTRKEAEHSKKMMSNNYPSQVNAPVLQRTRDDITSLLNENDIEDPENDWSHHSLTFVTATICAAFTCMLLFGVFFLFSILNFRTSPILEIVSRSSGIGRAFSGLYGVILFSLSVEVVLVKSSPWVWYPLEFLNIGGFTASIMPFVLPEVIYGIKLWLQGYFAAAYILFALIHRVFDVFKKYEILSLMFN